MIVIKNIAVLGGGSFGTALAKLLHDNGNHVKVWSYDQSHVDEVNSTHRNEKFLAGIVLSDEIVFYSDINIVMENVELIVLALPSAVTSSCVEQYKHLFNENHIVVNVSKGFDPKTKKRLSEAIKQHINSKVCVLSGPSHAEEVANEMITAVTISGENLEIAGQVQNIFNNSYFRVYTNDDIIGVEIAGSLKNVIALATGIAEGTNCGGDNARAALMTRGMYEISVLGLKMGADHNTFFGLAGMGDLIVTCGSMHSRNRRAGILLGQGVKLQDVLASVGMVVEGIEALKISHALAKELNVEMPLVNEMYSILFEGKDAMKSLTDLMSRDIKQEKIGE